MKIFAAANLTERSLVPVTPWEFKPTEELTAQIRHDKETRQEWYQNVRTRHQFYTLIESANPNQRVSREDNPPRLVHGIAADYDQPSTPEARKAAIARM